jgi:hypothetical protein
LVGLLLGLGLLAVWLGGELGWGADEVVGSGELLRVFEAGGLQGRGT